MIMNVSTNEVFLSKTQNKQDISYFIIASLISILLPIIYITFLGTDNTSVFYYDIIHSDNYWRGQYENYRYAPAFVGWIIYKLSYGYYNFIYMWSLFFSFGVIFCSYEFQKYARLSKSSLPFIIAAVSVNGYMADLYAFSMVFMAFGISYTGTAIALRSLRKVKGVLGVLGASTAVVVVCSSYQVTSLILLFAITINIVMRILNGDTNTVVPDAIRNIASFLIGVFSYLVIKEIFGPDYGRNVSLKYISNNIHSYIEFIPNMLWNGISNFNSSLELYLYLLCLFVVAIFCILNFMSQPKIHSIMAIIAFVFSILILACPFTLFPEGFWPAPRQMTASVFFFVGCAAVCYSIAKPYAREKLGYFSIFFIAFSLVSQIQHFAFMKGQDERDALAVQLITAEIEEVAAVTAETKIAVVSSYRTPINSNHRMSAFNEPWSHGAIFRVLTGKFHVVPPPDGSCSANSNKPWYIQVIDETVVVCMK